MRIGVRSTVGLLLTAMAGAAMAQFGAVTGETLIQAIRDDNQAKIEEIVKGQQQLVNSRSVEGQTPVMLAIDKRSLPILGFLLFHKADPNGADGRGELPLVAAARKGWADGVDGLLQMGATVDGRNRQGETALIAAVHARNPRVIRQLLAKGADPDIADRLSGYSARDYARRDDRNPELSRLIGSFDTK